MQELFEDHVFRNLITDHSGQNGLVKRFKFGRKPDSVSILRYREIKRCRSYGLFKDFSGTQPLTGVAKMLWHLLLNYLAEKPGTVSILRYQELFEAFSGAIPLT